MPRTARASAANYCYHVLNRGNGRARVFHKEGDYDAFVDLFGEARLRFPTMRLLAYVLMSNHFHVALWPTGDGDLGRWIHWVMTAHVRRYLKHDHSSGHVWQGRFKAFPVQEDEHLLTVVRYIERNPLRAGLVGRAEGWRWSSLHALARGVLSPLLDPGPVSARYGMGRGRERAAVRGRVATGPGERAPWRSVRWRDLGGDDGREPGIGIELAPEGSSPETRDEPLGSLVGKGLPGRLQATQLMRISTRINNVPFSLPETRHVPTESREKAA